MKKARKLHRVRCSSTRLGAVLLGSVAALTGASTATAGTLISWTTIGGLKTDRTYDLLDLPFGQPNRAIEDGNLCRLDWVRLGLHIDFVGYPDPCANGAPYAWTVTDHRWHTSRGLRVGDQVRRIRARYPTAARHDHSWWLLTANDDADEPTWALRAVVRGGVVRRIDQSPVNAF